MARVTAVVGGQYGSEGKGVIVAKIANRYDVHVRVGGPNAGHSFFHQGKKWVMQAIPCGWINPYAEVYIGSGGLIEIETLRREFQSIYAVDKTIAKRLKISPQAGVLSEAHHKEEGGVHGEKHQRIGSTGEGVGAARIARIDRDPSRFQLASSIGDVELGKGFPLRSFFVDDPIAFLPSRYENGKSILLEGTQGFGLSLIHGPWPYVTSSDVSASQLCADSGLSPRTVTDIILVVRTFPIRVAGNSGPLEQEMTWEQMSEIVGAKIEERTTVTKKVRRIGAWDEKLVKASVAVNMPTAIACTFMDYLDPTIAGRDDVGALTDSTKARSFIQYLELSTGVRVAFVGTGGPEWEVIER